MILDLQLDDFFSSKGFIKKYWGGNSLIYIRDVNIAPFKSDIFSVVNSNGMLHQISFGVYFKELSDLSYYLFRKVKPQFGAFEDKRMVASNLNYYTYCSVEENEVHSEINFKDDKESSKYIKLFNFYEDKVRVLYTKFQKIEDFKYLFINAHKLGESDLLTLLYIAKLYKPDKQDEIIERLDAYYQEKLLSAGSERRKSLVLELKANTEKRKKILNELSLDNI